MHFGLSLDETIRILGEPTYRKLPGLDDNVAVWESQRGMLIVFLDEGGQTVRRAMWQPARQESDFKMIWRYVFGTRPHGCDE